MTRVPDSRRRRTVGHDMGSITGFVVVMTLIVVVCAGLALDGARIVGAKVSAGDHAENAARVGAQEVASVHGGVFVLDPGRARSAAQSYLSAHRLNGSVVASPEQVTVTVSERVDTTLLQLVGISSKTVTATRASAPVSG